jgi:hypothetical protein
MDISILGYKLSIEILILIGVVYLILVGHTVCGCCNVNGVMEGLQNMAAGKKMTATISTTPSLSTTSSTPSSSSSSSSSSSTPSSSSSTMLMGTQSTTGVTPTMSSTTTEGFTGANTNYGLSAQYNLDVDKVINTSSWFLPDLVITPGQPLSQGVKNILDRPKQPVPLPPGQLFMFANTNFKPECCPNTYSTGAGCACMTMGQYNYLINRGGNNVPYSEY